MTLPRRAQIALECTPFYHCVSRCVRRAFLCGIDRYTQQNFEHRKQWLLDRLRRQAEVFALDICAYAIMSNHYHLVLRVDKSRAEDWSDDEVMLRWTKLFKGPVLVQRHLAGQKLGPAEQEALRRIVAAWRNRLCDISWYMRCLNEFVARRANAEDDCTGRFWEGRFKCQALLDQASLLACMAYVDLNPVRAGIARTLAESDFTSIQERLQLLAEGDERTRQAPGNPPMSVGHLLPFFEARSDSSALPYTLRSYLELVQDSGRMIVSGESCAMSALSTSLLKQLSLSPEQWRLLNVHVRHRSMRALGSLSNLREFAYRTGRARRPGPDVLRKASP